MKLKKIVSLALAGIMAVSMLAACGDNSSNNGSSSEAPVATGMVGKVIAALDEDVTDVVTFTAGSSLQNTLNVAAAQAGNDNTVFAAIDNTTLVALNKNLGSSSALAAIESTNTADVTDNKTLTSVFVVSASGTDEEFVAAQLAAAIAKKEVSGETSKTIADLPAKSNPDVNSKYQYNFKYTGEMAVVSSTDASTGETTYVLAFTITRTPTKVTYSEV